MPYLSSQNLYQKEQEDQLKADKLRQEQEERDFSVTPQQSANSVYIQPTGTSSQQQQISLPTTDRRQSGMGKRLSNLRRYIEENQPIDLTKPIQKGLEQQGQQIQTGLDEAVVEAQKKAAAEQARLATGSQIASGIQETGKAEAFAQPKAIFETRQYPETYQGYTAPTQAEQEWAAGIDPTAEARQQRFSRLYGGEWEDPTQNLATQQQALENLKAKTTGAATEAGRLALLRETFGAQPGYTQGKASLDQLLLQADPQRAKALSTIAQSIPKPLEEQLAATQASQEGLKTGIQTQAEALQKQLKDYIEGNITPEGEGSVGELARIAAEQQKAKDLAEQAKVQEYQNLITGLNQYKLTPEQMKALGFEPGQILYGQTPAAFTEAGNLFPIYGAPAPELAETITPEQVAKYQALAKLSGQEDVLYPSLTPVEAVPTYDPMRFGEIDKYKQFLTTGKEVYNQNLIQKQQELNDAVKNVGLYSFVEPGFDRVIQAKHINNDQVFVRKENSSPYGTYSINDVINKLSQGIPWTDIVQQATYIPPGYLNQITTMVKNALTPFINSRLNKNKELEDYKTASGIRNPLGQEPIPLTEQEQRVYNLLQSGF